MLGRCLPPLALALLASGCAAKGFVAPAGPGRPTSAAAPVVEAWARSCAAIDSLTAEAALSGRVARGRVRGRLHVGLTAGGGVRLEAVAPFGPPLFTLAGDAAHATLWLPREGQVLRDAPPVEIIDAIAGLELSSSDLLAVMTGCLGTGDAIVQSTQFDGLTRTSTRTGVDVWWRLAGAPTRPVAIVRGELQVEYLAIEGDQPTALRLTRRSAGGDAVADLRLSLAQREVNAAIDPAAFHVQVPDGAKPLSLDELRRAGLFGSR